MNRKKGKEVKKERGGRVKVVEWVKISEEKRKRMESYEVNGDRLVNIKREEVLRKKGREEGRGEERRVREGEKVGMWCPLHKFEGNGEEEERDEKTR